jgi:asparaginyl-tRNA synthetase
LWDIRVRLVQHGVACSGDCLLPLLHLADFWMIEPEISSADLSDYIDLAEDYLKYCVQYALESCADDLEFFENNAHGEKGLRDRLRNVLDNEFKVSLRPLENLKIALAMHKS